MRLFSLLLASAVLASAEPLDALLARMDQAAKNFQGYTAKFKRTDITYVIKETSESHGEIRSKVTKSGVAIRFEFQGADPSIVHVTNKSVEVFYPKANIVNLYDVSKYKGLEDFFKLGFGTTAAQLNRDYTVKLGDVEQVAGKSSTRIDLTPKSMEVRNNFPKIELWFPEGESYPIQERVTQSSKDTNTLLYSDLKVNPPLQDSDIDLKLPANVKRVRPGK